VSLEALVLGSEARIARALFQHDHLVRIGRGQRLLHLHGCQFFEAIGLLIQDTHQFLGGACLLPQSRSPSATSWAEDEAASDVPKRVK
jgi:hypothetical protein